MRKTGFDESLTITAAVVNPDVAYSERAEILQFPSKGKTRCAGKKKAFREF